MQYTQFTKKQKQQISKQSSWIFEEYVINSNDTTQQLRATVPPIHYNMVNASKGNSHNKQWSATIKQENTTVKMDIEALEQLHCFYY